MAGSSPFPGARPGDRQTAALHGVVVRNTPQGGPGVLHKQMPGGTVFEVQNRPAASVASDHPWKITKGKDPFTIKISPGRITGLGGEIKPKIGGVALDLAPPAGPPLLTVPVGTHYVVIGFQVTAGWGSFPLSGTDIHYITSGSLKSGTQAIIITTPVGTPPPGERNCILNYIDGTDEYGQFYIAIGSVSRTTGQDAALTITGQFWKNNIAAALVGDGSLFLAVG